jgi:predicted phage tail protein
MYTFRTYSQAIHAINLHWLGYSRQMTKVQRHAQACGAKAHFQAVLIRIYEVMSIKLYNKLWNVQMIDIAWVLLY